MSAEGIQGLCERGSTEPAASPACIANGAVLHSMAASYDGYFGTKVYSTHPKYGANFTFLLYDSATARPLARFEANHLGQIRTGAASGLATDLLAPDQPLSVAIIGTGFQARTQFDALRSVRALSRVRSGADRNFIGISSPRKPVLKPLSPLNTPAMAQT